MKPRPQLAFLPSLVTFTGIFLGLLSMLWAPHAPYAASIAILLACTCDLLDGRIARATGTESVFGVQLDSLADVINCGIAPAFLIYHWSLHGWMVKGIDFTIIFIFLYVACAAGRLARFNIGAEEQLAAKSSPSNKETSTEQPHPRAIPFEGLPTPVGAMLICTWIMAHKEIHQLTFLKRLEVVVPFIVITGLLMISKIPFRSFKQFGSRWGKYLFFGSILGGYTLLLGGGPGGSILLLVVLTYTLSGVFSLLRPART